MLLVCCVVLPLAYLILAYEIVEDRREGLDDAVSHGVVRVWTAELTEVMRLVSHLGGTVTIDLVYLGLGAWLVSRRRWQAGLVVVAAGGIGQFLVSVLKEASHRARPDVFPALVDAGGFSFPSGHTFGATLAWGLVAGVVAANLSGRARLIPWAVWGVGVIAVGFSRIYLGAHYATDVLASMVLGSAWLLGWLLVIGRLGIVPAASRARSVSTRSRYTTGPADAPAWD
jgi:undecaprenyl-diphosphatase